MAVDRSKFKRTSVAQMEQADKELNRTLGKKKGTDNNLELDEGTNLIRIYPPHPREDNDPEDPADPDSFAVPMVRTFLPAMVQERDQAGNLLFEDQAKKKPKMKKSVKPIFNSKVHAGTPKDLVEEYIKLATNHAKETIEDEEKRKEYLDKVYGNFAKKINGITYQTKFVMYIDKYINGNPDSTPVFGRYESKPSIKDRLNKIAAVESANDPLGTDPYTDVEEGRAVRILYNPNAEKAQDYYTTEIDTSQTTIEYKGKPQKVLRTYPLSDAQLERFMQAPSLRKLFKNSFTRKDFEHQVNGLAMFDKENKMGLWNTPEWADILEEIDSYYPEVEEEAPVEPGAEGNYDLPFSNGEEDGEETSDDEDGDDLTLMSRAELITYAKENKTGILAKPKMSDDEIRDKIRQWRAANESAEEPEEQPKEEPPAKGATTGKPSLKDRLNKFKKPEGGEKGDGLPF